MTRKRSTIDVIVRNSFHNTSYRFYTRWYKPLSRDQIRLCRKRLCGIPDCSCGGTLSQNGPQDVVIMTGFNVLGQRIVTLEPIRKRLDVG